MAMLKKVCLSCARDVWHNQAGKNKDKWRCTFCGTPLPLSNPMQPHKREEAEKRFRFAVAQPLPR